ncbi:alpha/beta hydrolase family esterase [Rhodoblastus sp.]|uniref:alpha/beta hydrolase family esterase n=1 Tax=Rhodoblastus sp. TaxID=1962975 RepID=UPI003F973C28
MRLENAQVNFFSSKRAVMAGLLALAASFFALPAPASAAARLTIESGGISRHAMVVLRDRLKLRRRPLIIVLRRGGGMGTFLRRRSGIEDIADTNRPIFVYPEAANGVWPEGPGAEADRDVKFLHDLVEHYINQGVADPRRIFLVGVSSGGVLAYRAACAGLGRPVAGLSTRFSAMPADLANCAPNPMAYVSVSLASDPRIPFGGGKAILGESSFDALPAEGALALFAKANGCGARREDKPFPEREPHGAAKLVRGAIMSYSGCKAPVELIRIDSGGYHNPGHRPEHNGEPAAEESGDFDASRAVWEFLKRNGA